MSAAVDHRVISPTFCTDMLEFVSLAGSALLLERAH